MEKCWCAIAYAPLFNTIQPCSLSISRCRGVDLKVPSWFLTPQTQFIGYCEPCRRDRCFSQSHVPSHIRPPSTRYKRTNITANTRTCTNTHEHDNHQCVKLQKQHHHTTRLTYKFDRHEAITYVHLFLQVLAQVQSSSSLCSHGETVSVMKRGTSSSWDVASPLGRRTRGIAVDDEGSVQLNAWARVRE